MTSGVELALPRLIDLPNLRASDVLAVQLEKAELAGHPVWIVTWRESAGCAPRRRWFSDDPAAVAYAAQEANRLGLMLLDLRVPASEQ